MKVISRDVELVSWILEWKLMTREQKGNGFFWEGRIKEEHREISKA